MKYEEKLKKLSGKYYEKKQSFLRKFQINFGNLHDSSKILDKSGIKLSKFK